MKVTAHQVRKAAEKLAVQVGVSAAVAISMVVEAMAELPVETTAAFTATTGHVTSIMALVWPLATLAAGGWVLLKLFKKGINKAT